jgi:hypothetical protein
MHRRPKAAKYRSPRSIAAITEGIIDEFGTQDGPFRMCVGICKTLFDHPDDPEYIHDFDRWTKVVNQVCARRRIAFDAERVCARIIGEIWSDTLKGTTSLEWEPQMPLEAVSLIFEELISESDVIHARGMGISLDR